MSKNKKILISFLVPGAEVMPKYGPRALDQTQERRYSSVDAYRAEGDAATLDFMRKLVSQIRVHVPASQTVLNELCRNHSNIFLDRVRHFDMWALKSKHFILCMCRIIRSVTGQPHCQRNVSHTVNYPVLLINVMCLLLCEFLH